MRSSLSLALGAVVLILGACDRGGESAASGPAGPEPDDAPESAAAAPAANRPELRGGLWAVTSETDGMTSTVRMCLDADVQRRMSVLGHEMAGAMCEENQITPRPGGGWATRTVCDMGSGGRVVSEGVTTGDMTQAYRTEVTSTTTGAAVPHMNRTSTSVVEGRHQGPCPEGMTAGDLEAPGGIRFNMLEMSAAAARMGAP